MKGEERRPVEVAVNIMSSVAAIVSGYPRADYHCFSRICVLLLSLHSRSNRDLTAMRIGPGKKCLDAVPSSLFIRALFRMRVMHYERYFGARTFAFALIPVKSGSLIALESSDVDVYAYRSGIILIIEQMNGRKSRWRMAVDRHISDIEFRAATEIHLRYGRLRNSCSCNGNLSAGRK